MLRLLFFISLVPALLGARASYAREPGIETPDALMLRFPDVSADKIVFAYAGDLWIVDKQGGIARRLSSPPGQEIFPKFSPDGGRIAFSGNYDGNIDVYVMPAVGGPPLRLTHHPAKDLVVEWYPDGGNILYRSDMQNPMFYYRRFFRQPAAGGMPETLPLAYGELAGFSPDGSRMAFQFLSREFSTWKRYRGGTASDLWIYNFADSSSEKITDFAGADALPMWHGGTIYFLSDRDERKKLNIWAMDVASRDVRQVTRFTEYDVKWPSLGPGEIVFENGGKLYLLELAGETTRPVPVQVPADLPRVRPQLKDASKNIESCDISPTGKRAVFGARGEVFTVPAEHGSIRNLTGSPGAAERYPVWSPDGKQIAYFSDKDGEYELYLRQADGKGAERRATRGGTTFRYGPAWSPSSQLIAFRDNTGGLFVAETASGRITPVDNWDPLPYDERPRTESVSWSADSRWLAYAKRMPNHNCGIFVYNVQTKKSFQVTGDFYDDLTPVFDPGGDYLFFYSSRSLEPVHDDRDVTWVYPNSTEIFSVALRRDMESCLAPRSDEEKPSADEKPADRDEEEDSSGQGEQPEPVEIDFQGIESRVETLPVAAGNFGPLFAAAGKLVFLRLPAAGAAEDDEPAGELQYYDLEEREEKTVISGIDSYRLSADGGKVLYKSGSTYGITDLAEGKNIGDGKIPTGGMKAWIDPPQEWKQIFVEAWRLMRQYFYDPGMHGVDWRAVRARYERLLPFVADRADLNYVIGEMIAELNVSHAYIGGGDLEQPETVKVGLLGCDFQLDPATGLYRIKKICRPAPWDAPDARSPLLRPGVQVSEGEYLLAVNGITPESSKDPWAAFQGLDGEVVALTVNSRPSPEGAREVIVEPLDSESRLRYLEWVENNRRRVEQATGGRAGYIYVPDTGINGQNELVRQLLPQCNRDALVIDERFNGGGYIPDRMIELLNRPVLNYWARRYHPGWSTPFVSHAGPKVMLINQWSGSGGDCFPYYFRNSGLGPLIGMRTWGGLIGISGNPALIDGGWFTVPTFSFYDTEGRWDIENHGVDPDFEVENPPRELAAGTDRQLDKAVEIILEMLEKSPPLRPARPANPDRSDGTTR
ncbi:MAG: PD40 domain-containing protein [Candidatus Glassbacteria bacterium]|nr:PD40 domain-containing protein [Candidatus Glassbacteria bacterium]